MQASKRNNLFLPWSNILPAWARKPRPGKGQACPHRTRARVPLQKTHKQNHVAPVYTTGSAPSQMGKWLVSGERNGIPFQLEAR